MITAEHIRHATGRQLAEMISVTPQAVSEWTQGKRHVSGLVLEQARLLGLPVSALIEGLDLRVADMSEARRFRAEITVYLLSRGAA